MIGLLPGKEQVKQRGLLSEAGTEVTGMAFVYIVNQNAPVTAGADR